MTAFINYNEIYNQVDTELRALQAEKELLLKQQHRIEQRLGAICAHEAKLQRVVESLADLLPADNSRQAVAPPVEFAAAADLSDAGAALAAELPITDSFAQPPLIEIQTETDDRAEIAALGEVESELSEDTTEFARITEDFAQPASVPESSHDRAAVPSKSSANRAPAPAPTIRQLADFDQRDFFERFAHVTKTHPVHILAGKLLEYFGYGLKLAEIARLIEQLGYQHNSRNFTDSVHSALKNKRKATGEFRFNAAKSVWELTRWQNDNLFAEKAKIKKAATADGNVPTTRLTEQVENQIAKQLKKASKALAKASSEKSAAASTATDTQSNTSGEQNKRRTIKVYKVQQR